MRRVLVVFFSRTGTTRAVAATIAEALGADVDEIEEPARRGGVLGYLRSAVEAALRRTPPIAAPRHDPAGYDLVIVGTPTWAMAPASPVRSYLRQHGPAIRQLACFATSGGPGNPQVLAQMAAMCGRQSLATLIVRQSELGTAATDRAIAAFVASLREAPVVLPTSPPPPPQPGADAPR